MFNKPFLDITCLKLTGSGSLNYIIGSELSFADPDSPNFFKQSIQKAL